MTPNYVTDEMWRRRCWRASVLRGIAGAVLVVGLAVGVLGINIVGVEQATQIGGGNASVASPDQAYPLMTRLWDRPVIAVCWENATTGNATERDWVQSAVAGAWERESMVDFTGWGNCSSGSTGIRIRIADEGPRTLGLGTSLNGVSGGMVLNFTFNTWSPSCQSMREYCIRAIANHEFGHALGFAHEQNRPDTPSSCTDAPQGTNGDFMIGAWDLRSIMNYCNPNWNGDGNLSGTDILAVRQLYGAPLGSVGRLELFARGSDGGVWHNWQTTPGGGGSGWAPLGGWVDIIESGRNADGRLEVFARGGDGAVWHKWQTTPGGGWSGWESLGGWVDIIRVGRNQDGRLEVFARSADGAVWHKWQTTPGGSWSGWASLGGWIDLLELGLNADGRLELFARGGDGAVWHKWQTTPSGGWSGWASLGGWIDRLAVGRNRDGRIEVFARGGDAALHHIWQTSPGSGWSGWSSLGGWIDMISVGRNADGRVEVFVRGADAGLWHIWQVPGGWSGWAPLGGWIDRLDVSQNADGRQEVFVLSGDGAVWHNWQTTPNGAAWSGWNSRGGWVDIIEAAQNSR